MSITDLTAANARQAKLEQAWKLADPTCKELDRDWKDPININGTELAIENACKGLGVTLHDVLTAIEHFTATMPKVERWRERKLAGARMIRITADGYRAGPAGDH
jgi:hypothetical protein